MDKASRKAAAAACLERRAQAGIYSLSCQPTGSIWVGSAQNLAARQNQITFALKNNGFTNRDLHAALATHGASAIRFAILETLAEPEEGLDAYTRRKWLTETNRKWREKLGAQQA